MLHVLLNRNRLHRTSMRPKPLDCLRRALVQRRRRGLRPNASQYKSAAGITYIHS